MTNISKSHKRFSERLQDPRVLSNPEEFLGPNYKAVLNFWLSIDDLSKDQWETINSRYSDFCTNQYSECYKAIFESLKASREMIGYYFAENAADAADNVYRYSAAFSLTIELISMHKILNQNNSLTFFNMFLKDL